MSFYVTSEMLRDFAGHLVLLSVEQNNIQKIVIEDFLGI